MCNFKATATLKLALSTIKHGTHALLTTAPNKRSSYAPNCICLFLTMAQEHETLLPWQEEKPCVKKHLQATCFTCHTTNTFRYLFSLTLSVHVHSPITNQVALHSPLLVAVLSHLNLPISADTTDKRHGMLPVTWALNLSILRAFLTVSLYQWLEEAFNKDLLRREQTGFAPVNKNSKAQ